jgi:hypothetical protein
MSGMPPEGEPTADAIASAVARGNAFDSFIAAAVIEQRGDGAKWELAAKPTFETVHFVELLRASGCPPDRIPRLVAMLNDMKLQHYFLRFEVLPSHRDRGETPAGRLHKAAVDQKHIVASRIFFERFMNLLYYLELGKELQGRSKKAAFFKMVRASERWLWMENFEALIDRYDAAYRTPEVHSGSFLRRQLERGESSVFWRTVAPQNLVYALFTEVEGVLAGATASLPNVVSWVASDWMVEGHPQYVPPWDEDEAEWRAILFKIAPLTPAAVPEDEPPHEPSRPPVFGETELRPHVESWMLPPGHVERTETGELVFVPDKEPGSDVPT